jgi:predicted DNA-binding protein
MKRRSLHLSDSQYEALARRSKETGAPVAELIRRAIDAYLTAQRPRSASRKETP